MERRTLRIAVTQLLLARAVGWVTLPVTTTERKLAWPMPVDPLDDAGLGGGIAFAISPTFCDELLVKFREDDGGFKLIKYVTCEDINDAFNRAMSTWAANHPYINFYNVTDECIAEGTGAACTIAELYIDTKKPARGAENVAAFVTHNPVNISRTYKRDDEENGTATRVRTPSGELVRDFAIQFATLTFHSHTCWYLDASFCSRFREMNEVLNATLLMQFVIWGCWACAFALLAARLVEVGTFVFRFGVRTGLKKSVRKQARELTLTYALLFLLITPPLIWYQIFLPCLSCYDFEATAVHELGHVLGFGHTDTFPNAHRVAIDEYSAETCRARLSLPGEGSVKLDPRDRQINSSVMYHVTTKRSRTCLSQNDLQGLLYSYPVCEEDAVLASSEPLCVKPPSNLGYVRFVLTIIPPFVVASVGIFCLAQLAIYYESKELLRNRWQLGGIAAMQTAQQRRKSKEVDFARGILDKPLRRSLSVSAGTLAAGSRRFSVGAVRTVGAPAEAQMPAAPRRSFSSFDPFNLRKPKDAAPPGTGPTVGRV